MLLVTTIALTTINSAFTIEQVTFVNTSFIEEYRSYVLTYSEEMKFTIIIDLKSIYEAYEEINAQAERYNYLPDQPIDIIESISRKVKKLKKQVTTLKILSSEATNDYNSLNKDLTVEKNKRVTCNIRKRKTIQNMGNDNTCL